MDMIREESDSFGFLYKLEALSGGKLQRVHILLGMMGLCVSLCMTRLGAAVVCVAGMAVGLRDSVVVMRQLRPSEENLKQLLSFWLFFSLMSAAEILLFWLIRYIPMYYVIKLVLLWMLTPLKKLNAVSAYYKTLGKCQCQFEQPMEAALKNVANEKEEKVVNEFKLNAERIEEGLKKD